jgi:hypothetical protein
MRAKMNGSGNARGQVQSSGCRCSPQSRRNGAPMVSYVAEFRVVGEIADWLHQKGPQEKLLVDISPDAPGHEAHVFRKYPTRISCTILDPDLIEAFLSEVSIGDVLDVRGSFTQSNYTPYRSTHIDTTCTIQSFRKLRGFRPVGAIRQTIVSPNVH